MSRSARRDATYENIRSPKTRRCIVAPVCSSLGVRPHTRPPLTVIFCDYYVAIWVYLSRYRRAIESRECRPAARAHRASIPRRAPRAFWKRARHDRRPRECTFGSLGRRFQLSRPVSFIRRPIQGYLFAPIR